MREYVNIISAIIAGFFAVTSAYFAWRLKKKSEEDTRGANLEIERRAEIKELYTGVFTLFEKAIKQILNSDEDTLSDEFSETNARIHLLAHNDVVSLYTETCEFLESWSKLQAKASPMSMKAGDQTITMYQAPDPTKKFQKPAQAEYEKLQEKFSELVKMMKSKLSTNT